VRGVRTRPVEGDAYMGTRVLVALLLLRRAIDRCKIVEKMAGGFDNTPDIVASGIGPLAADECIAYVVTAAEPGEDVIKKL
jgi:hypothetical protein